MKCSASDTVRPGRQGNMAGRAGSVILAMFLAFGVTGCAGSSAPPQSAPPPAATTAAAAATSTPAAPSAALCSAAAEFQTAANAIAHLNAVQVGTSGVKAALQNLQTAGRNLATAARDQY